jgi:hypothetical protein
MYVDLGMERSKAGVLESLNVITPLTVREGTRGADFGGVPPLCYGGGHLRQKKSLPCHQMGYSLVLGHRTRSHYSLLPSPPSSRKFTTTAVRNISSETTC